jgi:SAM-dependent methyltransferase/glycosyltransferase involved in cell wall biosynthesis
VKTFICTIVARNYLAQAITLAHTVKDHAPGSNFHVLVIDGDASVVEAMLRDTLDDLPPARLVDLTSLSISGVETMVSRYSPIELATALKPFLLTWLLNQGYDGGIYLDPDIWVMGKLDELLLALQEHDIVLTPHLLEPLPEDGKRPDNVTILRAGTYNLGFLGISGTPEARRFLNWWADVLRNKCIMNPQDGYHVDQKWIDLAVGYLRRVYICRSTAYNVAYWNLHERDLSVHDGQFQVNGQPLIFFHFSGYDLNNPEQLSFHQNRHEIEVGSPLHRLLQTYADILKRNGFAKFSQIPYGLANKGVSTESGIAVPPRVVVAGYLNQVLGLGEFARNIIAALRAAGLDVSSQTFDAGTRSPLLPEGWDDERKSLFFRSMPRANIVVVNPDQAELFEETIGLDFFRGACNIGVWNWELPEFPEEWARAADRFLEIWVASSFTQQAVAQRVRKPVLTMPTPIPLPSKAEVSRDRRHFGIPAETFVFLFIFDFCSIFERKNPLGAINAFTKAFPNNDRALLMIKTVNGHADPKNLARLKRAVRDGKNVRLLETPFSRSEVIALMSCCDCYVSLHRSEGFGLTIAEAMALEKPVIATGWSGNLDFMTINNSFLVSYTLRTLESDYGPYKAGNTWAEPDLDHAAQLMREVSLNPEKSRLVALRGAQTIYDRLSVEAVGRRMASRLAVVMSEMGTPTDSGIQITRPTPDLDRERLIRKAALIDLNKVRLPPRGLRRTAKRVIRKGVSWLVQPSLEQARSLAVEQTGRIFDLDARISNLDARIHQLERRSGSLLRPIAYRNPVQPSTTHRDETEYRSFERVFRGGPELLQTRYPTYVRWIPRDGLVLDVGCGTGDLLAWLQQNGVNAEGVDIDPSNIREAQVRGLQVLQNDALEYLARALSRYSCILSTQFVEHLRVDRLPTFISAAWDALVPGGVFLAETVNPYNLNQFRLFWLDPTHTRPIYPELFEFYLAKLRFEHIETKFLPCFNEPRTSSELEAPWDYCDYLIVARKPGSPRPQADGRTDDSNE